jgi:tyrosine-protein kinase Etk/Wzc
MNPNQPSQPPADEEISLLDILLAFAENIRLLILVPIAAGTLTFVYGSLTTETNYTAKTTLLGQSNSAGAGMGIGAIMAQMTGLGTLGGFGASGVSSADQKLVAYLGKREVAARLIKQFDLVKVLGASSPEAAIEALGDMTRIEQNKKTQLLEISVSHTNPMLAADLANGYVAELQALLQTEDKAQSKSRLETLDKMISEVTNRPHRVEVGRQILQGLLQQYESAKLSALGAGEGGRVTVVDIAVPPTTPDPKGRLKAVAVAALITLVVLMLLVFARLAVRIAGENAEGARKLSGIRAAIRKAITWK